MTERRPPATVHVGLDVHAASIRLAAVRADEPLDERTLPYDHEAVERAVMRWPRVRCCQAGPTGFGLARHLRMRGIACDVVAPGLVPVRPGESEPARIDGDFEWGFQIERCIVLSSVECFVLDRRDMVER